MRCNAVKLTESTVAKEKKTEKDKQTMKKKITENSVGDIEIRIHKRMHTQVQMRMKGKFH